MSFFVFGLICVAVGATVVYVFLSKKIKEAIQGGLNQIKAVNEQYVKLHNEYRALETLKADEALMFEKKLSDTVAFYETELKNALIQVECLVVDQTLEPGTGFTEPKPVVEVEVLKSKAAKRKSK